MLRTGVIVAIWIALSIEAGLENDIELRSRRTGMWKVLRGAKGNYHPTTSYPQPASPSHLPEQRPSLHFQHPTSHPSFLATTQKKSTSTVVPSAISRFTPLIMPLSSSATPASFVVAAISCSPRRPVWAQTGRHSSRMGIVSWVRGWKPARVRMEGVCASQLERAARGEGVSKHLGFFFWHIYICYVVIL